MRVRVVAYNPHWPAMFEEASAEIVVALQGHLVEIHHIGSTAILGMDAKPIIDMMPVVSDIAALDGLAGQFETLGYEAMGEFGITGRRYYRRNNSAGERTHQIHAFAVGSPNVGRHLAFRNFMRAHPREAAEYAELKRRLAEAFPGDIEAYSDGKDAFIEEMEKRAMGWGPRDE